MAETPSPPKSSLAPAGPAGGGAGVVRIVLFGRARSGKSALLEALGEVVRQGAGGLNAELTSRGGEMERLGQEGAEGGGPIVAYPVRYLPASGGAPPLDVVFLDCDGAAASELLGRVEELEADRPELPLARAVLAADAMVLAVDASAPPEQLEADFAAFQAFLGTFEARRGQDTAVGGLPVFLVLTHADLLAHPLDSVAEWVEVLEGRKREVDRAFQAYLEEASGGESGRRARPGGAGGAGTDEEALGEEDVPGVPAAVAEEEGEDVEPEEEQGRESGFGWVDLRVWATAVKRPKLRGAGGAEGGPYGVGELFRQCLAGAADYRRREERSRRRLLRLVLVAVAVVALLVVLTVAQVFVDQQGRPGALAARVENLRALGGGAPEEYLRGSLEELRERQRGLREVWEDAQFESLSDELRFFVVDRLEELTDYIGYYERLQKAPGPFDEWSAEGLERLHGRLTGGDLALPRPTWGKTAAGVRWGEREKTAGALLGGVRELVRWYDSASSEAGKLWTFSNHAPRAGAGVPWGAWSARAQEVLRPKAAPYEAGAALPGAPPGLTYADAMRFFEVKDARIGWELERDRLSGLLDVVGALGLERGLPGRPAVLAIPRDFRLEDAPGRLRLLKAAYPEATRSFGGRLPEAAEGAIAQAAREEYRALLAPARAEVQRRYRGSAAGDAAGQWADVRAWLKTARESEEWAAWGELALVLLRLFEARPEAPLPALAAFLEKKEFLLTFDSVVVEARRFSGVEPEEKAALTVTLSAGKKETELAFALQGGGRVDLSRNVVQYTYRLKEKQALVYVPGAGLSASLPLKGAAGEARPRLVWVDHRSPRYQFERLRNPPRRQAGAGPPGAALDDVRLIFQPDGGVPTVPDLLPEE